MEKKCQEINLKELCRYLKKHNNYVILTHISPDGDTLGSAFALALALKSIGKNAFVVSNDDIPQKFNYFVKPANLKSFDYETIIAVDVADARLLGSLYEKYADKVELTIDHHISNTRYAKRLYLDDNASATAECIFELIKKLRVKITPLIATCLYTGIATDTGCFKYSNVTPKTHLIAAELCKSGIDAAEINRRMFDTKSRNQVELEKMVLETAEFHFNDRCMLLTVTSEMQEKSGCEQSELEGVAAMSRTVEGVKVGVSIKQTEPDLYKISVRTYEPFDASRICAQLGGGGHRAAGGCSVSGTLSEVKEKILGAVERAFEEYDAGTALN